MVILKKRKMIMTEKYKILAKYIKDLSSETPDLDTYLFVKDNVSKYNLNIDITSKVLKEKIIEINTTLKFSDNELNEKKSYFEIVYATIIKVGDEIKEKKDLEKIILCDVQKEIYPDLETSFLNLLHNSGYPEIKFDKKIDFEKLYNQKSN
jgi:preprotein translocase subunit SecB